MGIFKGIGITILVFTIFFGSAVLIITSCEKDVVLREGCSDNDLDYIARIMLYCAFSSLIAIPLYLFSLSKANNKGSILDLENK